MASSIDLSDILNGYVKEVREGLDKSKDKIAKEAVSQLHTSSPKKTGKYAADWSVKNEGSKRIVYNRKHYQVTHLLENGHANRDGSRTSAQVHIKPVDDYVADKFQNEVKQVIINAR